jgi:hypothetical protein
LLPEPPSPLNLPVIVPLLWMSVWVDPRLIVGQTGLPVA